jgi:CRP/FNR family cyclic AMP-dependent transcriptional regulator
VSPLEHVGWVELTGYLAAGLVFVTFYMKTMIPLRVVAIASNVAFMTYAAAAGLGPVFALHAILLPLNCIRLYQVRVLIKRVRASAHGDLSMEWLLPYLRRRTARAGQVVFRKGERAEEMYLLLDGSIHLVELGVTVGPGALLGEIGIFAPSGQRMDTAVCDGDVELGVIENGKVAQLYYQNPRFGFWLIRLIVQRLEEDYVKLRAGAGPGPPAAPSDPGSR